MRARHAVLPLLAALLAATAAVQADSAVVRTSAELRRAVSDGVAHIVVSQHLNLTGLEAPAGGALLTVGPRTKSIRVRSL